MGEQTAESILLDNGYEGVVYFENYSYDDALIGVSTDNRAIYDYQKMVEWLMVKEGWTEEESRDWIDYNTLNAHMTDADPIVMFPIERY